MRLLSLIGHDVAVPFFSASQNNNTLLRGRKKMNRTLLICVVTFTATALNTQADTQVGGIIDVNTTWSVENSPYVLTDTVQIAYGATLTIEPGVSINGSGRLVQVWGTLDAAGNEQSKIIFNNVSIGPGISGSSTTPFLINIKFSEINAGSIYSPTGYAIYGSLVLQDSILRDTSEYMYLWTPTSDCYIERNIFDNTGGISVGIGGNRKVYVRNNVFYNQTTNSAVENWVSSMTSELIVRYNSFLSNDRIALMLPSGYSDTRMTATQNYWNTLDTDIIDSMIYDRNDDLGCADYIDYIPVLTEPHPNTPIFPLAVIGDFCGVYFGPPDGYVDVWDLMQFADQWHTRTGDSNWDSKFDLTGPDFGDPAGYVDVWDLMVFADHWHEGQKP